MHTHISKSESLVQKKGNSDALNTFEDNRSDTLQNQELQSSADNSTRDSKALQLKSNQKGEVIQGMFSKTYKPITTLNELNIQIGLLVGSVIPAFSNGDFNYGQTSSELDTAIGNSNLSLYDTMQQAEIKNAIDTELAKITADPSGYVRMLNGNFIALVDSKFNLTTVQEKLLVNASNGQGSAVHKSSKTRNMSSSADAYIHDFSDNAIFSYKIKGTHRGIPMVEVLQQGKVNSGMHNF